MKKVFVRSLFAIGILIAAQSIAHAQFPNALSQVNDKGQVQVKYAGRTDQFLLFDIMIVANANERVSLNVQDEKGSDLYSESIFASTAVRRMKIEPAEFKQLHFSISSRSKNFSKVFTVSTSYVEKTEVQEQQ